MRLNQTVRLTRRRQAVFTPRHPKTKPKLEDVEAAEAALDVDTLVAEALAGVEHARFDVG